MNLQKAIAEATPGPLGISHNERGIEIFSKTTHNAVCDIPSYASHGAIDAALLVHCRNRFLQLVEALGSAVSQLEDEYPEVEWVERGLIEMRELIARAKEVEGI